MSIVLTWIFGIIAFLIVFGLFVLLDIKVTVKDTKETKSERDNKQYATTCIGCGLEFDFGDYDIKMYSDQSGKQHQITQCPRCKTYINVDP